MIDAPRWASPLVAMTSTNPSPTSSTVGEYYKDRKELLNVRIKGENYEGGRKIRMIEYN